MPNHITNVIQMECSENERKKFMDYIGQDEEEPFDFDLFIKCPEILKNFPPHLEIGFPVVTKNFIEQIRCHWILSNKDMGKCFYRLIKENSIAVNEIMRRYNTTEFLSTLQWMLECFTETGCTDPLVWNHENWGTKWNSYDVNKDHTITFLTAWSHPFPVMVAMSNQFSKIEFNIKYADEDIGNNFGHYIMKNGKIIKEVPIENETKFCIQLKGFDYDEYMEEEE